MTSTLLSFSQQVASSALTFHDFSLYNPASGGLTGVLQAQVSNRYQWLGIDDAPRTFFFNGHTTLDFTNTDKNTHKDEWFFERPAVTSGVSKHVVGATVMREEIGIFEQTDIGGNYALHLPLDKTLTLGLGVRIGWHSMGIQSNRVVLYDQYDMLYGQALAMASTESRADIGLGAVLYGKNYLVGGSLLHLLNSRASFGRPTAMGRYQRHYFLHASYNFALKHNGLEPTVVLKSTANSPTTIDFGIRYIHRNATWIGVYGKTSPGITFQLGTTLVKNFFLCYSYEHSFKRTRTLSDATHEFVLGVYIGRSYKKNKQHNTASEEIRSVEEGE